MERLPILKICQTHGMLTGCRAALAADRVTDNHCTECAFNNTENCIYFQGVEAHRIFFQAKEEVCVGRCDYGSGAGVQVTKKAKVWDAICAQRAALRVIAR